MLNLVGALTSTSIIFPFVSLLYSVYFESVRPLKRNPKQGDPFIYSSPAPGAGLLHLCCTVLERQAITLQARAKTAAKSTPGQSGMQKAPTGVRTVLEALCNRKLVDHHSLHQSDDCRALVAPYARKRRRGVKFERSRIRDMTPTTRVLT